MSEEKTRSVSLKGMLHKAKITKTPAKFFSDNKELLKSTFNVSNEFFDRLDNKSLKPSEGIVELRSYLHDKYVKSLISGIKLNTPKPKDEFVKVPIIDKETGDIKVIVKKRSTKPRNYSVHIYEYDTLQETKYFVDSVSAENYVNNRLSNADPGAYAEIQNNIVSTLAPMKITRDKAMANKFYKRNSMAFRKIQTAANPKQNMMRAKGDRFHYSRG